MPVDVVRDAAIDVLLRVFDRSMHLDVSLDKTIRRRGDQISERGRRFLTQLVYGTTRHMLLCDHVLRRLCSQPLDKLPTPVLMVLRMAVFQSLFCDQVTHPAMVHTSVDLARKRGHAGLAKVANAVLRKCPQRMEDVHLPDREKDLGRYLSVRYSLPKWLVDLWLEDFGPEGAEAAAIASNAQAPACLRVNTNRISVESLQTELATSGILCQKQTPLPEELTVVSGDGLTRSKRFQQGFYTLQDPASMLPAILLEPGPGDRVLDCCAAPGGKATHIAQRTNNEAWVVAMDASRRRMEKVVENAERLGAALHCVVGDGANPPLQGQFDRVLVDAPCSGLGTLRRHPDLKWHMTNDTITRLAGQQLALLRRAVTLCKNNGCIVYSVCTNTRQETRDVVHALLQDGTVTLENGPESLDTWRMDTGQYATQPSGAWDGFFLTRFRKRS
jgi:16S rRNA (cytosine967-C5)-methyltransferase